MSEDHIEVLLRMICNHDGEWSWYQIDRALTTNGIFLQESLIVVLHELEEKGFISAQGEANPAQPRYSITELGREVLAENRSFPN